MICDAAIGLMASSLHVLQTRLTLAAQCQLSMQESADYKDGNSRSFFDPAFMANVCRQTQCSHAEGQAETAARL